MIAEEDGSTADQSAETVLTAELKLTTEPHLATSSAYIEKDVATVVDNIISRVVATDNNDDNTCATSMASNCRSASDDTDDVQLDAIEPDQLDDVLCSELSGEWNFSSLPTLVAVASADFRQRENFTRGCLWSPDGSGVLCSSADNCLRVFNLTDCLHTRDSSSLPSSLLSSSHVRGHELIYDFCWYPHMNSLYPETCCMVTSSRDNPIQLWDSLSGFLRCTYRAFNDLDELTCAHSVMFSADGQRLYGGFTKVIRVFDVSRPGRECETRMTYEKIGQAGILSCLALNPRMPTMYTAGSFNRSVAVYTEPRGDMLCMYQGQQGGVTHVRFSPDGNVLFTGGRKDPEILCWDLRKPGEMLYTLQRLVTTNQRMYFDVDSSGRYLLSGNQNGTVSVWDLTCAPVSQMNTDPVLPPLSTFHAHNDTVNGLSCHPSLSLIVTGSGQRHFAVSLTADSTDSSDDDQDADTYDNSLKIWRINSPTETID